MANIQYIGARYVPKYYQNSLNPSSSEWESGKVYEALTVVTWNDVSYTSKIPVPANIGAPDLFPAYWVKTVDMPAVINALQQEVSEHDDEINTLIKKSDSFVTPEMFGAVGDGVADDGDAIRAAIAYANDNDKILLFNRKNYLYTYDATCTVNCDIDFNDATIILNNVYGANMAAFTVGDTVNSRSYTESIFTSVRQIAESTLFGKSFTLQSPIDLGKRDGTGAHKYYTQHLMVDDNGYIVSSEWGATAAAGTYKCINCRDINEERLSIKNVNVVSNNTAVTYGNTFLIVRRNNVEISGISVDYTPIENHDYIDPIIDLIDVSNCKISDIIGFNPYGPSSGYIIDMSHCCNILVERVVGTNKSGGSWGSLGTDCCYDVTYNDCITERLDTHTLGTYTANNCNLNYANFAGGKGNVIFNNCHFTDISNERIIMNRRDYQYILSGNVIINNCYFAGSSSSAKMIDIYLNRPDDVVNISEVAFAELNVIVKDSFITAGLLLSLDVQIQDFADHMNFIYDKLSFRSNNIANILQDSVVMNSFKMIDCHSRHTSAVSFYGTNKFKYVDIVGSKFSSQFRERTANDVCILSLVNNVLTNGIETLTTKCVRLIDNISVTDVAPTITTPTYEVKSGNLIVAGTNTHQSDWND